MRLRIGEGLDDRPTHREDLRCLPHRAPQRRRRGPVAVVFEDADPQALDRDTLRIGPRDRRDARVELLEARRGEHAHRELEVGDRARHRTGVEDDRLHAREEQLGRRVEVRQAPGGRPEALDPAEVRRRPDAAADVGGEPERRATGRDDRALAAAAAAARALEVPGVVRPAEERVVALLVEEQLGHVRLAEDDRARVAQAAHERPFRCRQRVAPARQPECRRQALDVELLFDGDRHAGERPEQVTAGPRAVHGGRLRARVVETAGDDGVQPPVHRLDAVDVRIDHLTRRDGSLSDPAGKLAGAAPRQLRRAGVLA